MTGASDDELSIAAAARDAGERAAIITRDRILTFADCARAAHALAARTSIVATPSIATILAIHAALDARRPLALLHPALSADELDRQRAVAPPHDAALVLFTSGSTGRPRGVALGRTALLAAAHASAAHLGWHDTDRWLLCLPLAHAGGASIVVRCLAARRAVVLHDAEFAAARVAELAAARRATLASFVPTQLDALVDRLDPRTIRAILVGGAASSPAVIARAIARGLPVLETYGLTETFGQVATARAPGERPRALPGITIATTGTRAHPAAIRIRAASLASHYLDDASSPIARELVTADLGFLDEDGALHVVGRSDDVIISGGENVHPAEVERVVLATPGVRAACAFGVRDARWGEIVGLALAIDRAAFDRAAALARWHAALPAHARPRTLALAAQLPQLPSGKHDRRAAAALASEPITYTPA